MADEEQAGTVDTTMGMRLILLDDRQELRSLSRAGWFKQLAPDRWKMIDLVHGRIKALLELATTYTAEQIGNAFGITRQRVQQLTAEGVLKPVRKGRYDRDQATRDYVSWLRDQNRLANKQTSEGRVRDARATEIEIRTAERSRRLITLDEALDSNATLCGFVRTEFGGLAASVTRDLTLRREIEKAVNERFARIADRLVQEAANLETGGNADEAVADDDAGPVGEAQPQLSTVSSSAGSA